MKISACIIAKDEEKNLPRLLKSLKGKFEEIILVDTGSKDRTVNIAKEYGCKVVKHKWKGFADARNRAIAEATGDWIWHFDADFELEEDEYKKALVYLKKIPDSVDAVLIGVKNFDKFGKVKGISSHIFIHRNKPKIKWVGKIHETPNVEFAIGIPVFVNHYGYADEKIQIEKAKRNLKLLEEEIKFYQEGSKTYNIKLFYLVQTYTILSSQDKSYLKKAKELALKFLDLIEGKEESYRFFAVYIYNYLLHVLEMLGDEKLYRKYLEIVLTKNYPMPDFYLRAFDFYRKKGEITKALENLQLAAEILDKVEENPFKGGIAFASDKISTFMRVVLTFNLDILRNVSQEELKEFKVKLKKRWRKKKGKNLGLLLYLLSEGNEKFSIIKKLAVRFKDEFVVFLYLKEIECRYEKSLIEKEMRLFRDLNVYWLFKAIIEEKYGSKDKALSFYKNYLELTKDLEVAKYLLLKYPDLKEKLESTNKKK